MRYDERQMPDQDQSYENANLDLTNATLQSRISFFQKAVFVFLVYNFLVILWGAWVRISFSGDGCGDSWPLCNGEVIPSGATKARWTEWSHRASTGIFGFAAIALFYFSRQIFPKYHRTRFYAGLTLFLTLTEALIGALLVKLGLVANNPSVVRAWAMGIHQINSLSLSAVIFLTAFYASPSAPSSKNWRTGFVILLAFSIVAFSGALASLAGTLFPSLSLLTGLIADFSYGSHAFVRLRLSHPFLAMAFGAAVFGWSFFSSQSSSRFRRNLLWIAIGVQISFGLMTLIQLSPTWMRLSHLAFAHALCVVLIYAIPNHKPD